MATINTNYNKVASAYVFSEIGKRVKAFIEKNPGVEIMRLGIGNTTEALTPTVVEGLMEGVKKLADTKTYTGYGDEQGDSRLRKELAAFYENRGISFEPEEIFISDGAKPDSANISSIFGSDNIVAVTDPVYPVYSDSNVIAGKKVVYMECKEENGFAPTLPKEKADLIFICSPNNPIGTVLTKKQLKAFVDYAKKEKAVIIFDAAYAEYISDKNLPRSIYEIPGAKSCAVEINSFSKLAGFTGVRLGWTVVPMDLVVEGEEKGKVNSLWNRRQTTMFNGASNIVQEGGLAVLSKKGQKECKKMVGYYMNNAKIIKRGISKMGLKAFGGENAPYIWLKVPGNMSSWEFFDKLLKEAQVVGTPGTAFGQGGEGYFRLSAFGHKENIEEAVKSIQKNLKL
ncbi:MAG: LL-diaminopimelate aminotransferase [Patescibacteria group bacterium]|nr:LL-diaminopimelate aminotransferase [Patescibacteria group bacterium]